MISFRKEFSTSIIVLMALAIAINISAGQIAGRISWLYIDSIGTILVGVLAGPWAGAVTGFLSNFIWTASGLNPFAFAFSGVAAVIGILAGVFGQAGWMKKWSKAALAGLITGLIAAVISAPIAAYVFGGVTGAGTDAVVALFRAAGLDMLGANVAQGVASDPLDKLASFLIVWTLLQALPKRFVARFSND